jgi:tripartite-type tricarboxylate transporter receptor subunit TctC
VLGFEATHVPYEASSQALIDMVAGGADFGVAAISTMMSLAHGGKLHALAVSSDRRHPERPNVPTAAEAGAKGYEYDNWTGLFAPA